MEIKINAVRFDIDQKLVDFVNKKVSKLDKFYDAILGVEVFLRVEKLQAEENKVAEIKVNIPGNDLFVKKQTNTFEESVSQAVDSLTRSLGKTKEKQRGV
ncbi:MAG: ribosome-associated translation inhibitor RaiA [Bacteroidales bacterium]|nr:ribosome-associated translation inhibitor RaiA [Bacteroidales bacterium]MBR3287882.1 ribosome-associated translation inhibitor RaiA [Bacteroidales bacterium]MCR5714862.1 ribosome-associated translation inhibitor RaiA [Bacteroidales bacterium]